MKESRKGAVRAARLKRTLQAHPSIGKDSAQALKVRVSPSTIGLDSVRENTAIYSSKVIYRTAVGLVLKNAAASRNAVGPEWLTSMRLAHCPIHHRYQH